MPENIGNLFLKMYATSHKRLFVPFLGLLYEMYRAEGKVFFCETSARVTNWVISPQWDDKIMPENIGNLFVKCM